VDLRRTLANTVITTYGSDFATASAEFVKRDSESAHVSFLPAHD
jgi:hypothetical protein